MTSMDAWDPGEVELKNITRSSHFKSNQVQAIKVENSNPFDNGYLYNLPEHEDAILHSISPISTNWVHMNHSDWPKLDQHLLPPDSSREHEHWVKTVNLPDLSELKEPRTYISTKRHGQITAEDLSEKNFVSD